MQRTIMKLGIVGSGFVGKASKTLENDDLQILSYDINPDLCSPKGTTLQDIGQCDLIFVSVPTPMSSDGSVHLKIVESVVEDLNKVILPTSHIVIRSTCPPGTCERLDTYFMPEFLTEANYIIDFINCELWIFGLKGDPKTDNDFKQKVTNMICSAQRHGKIKHSNIQFTTNTEAEIIKYFRNTYLATKVSFCNEMSEFCEKIGVNYDNVRNVACLDKRIGLSHSAVPGFDGHKGFGGTCFPKDTIGLKREFDKIGLKSYVLKAIVERNEEVDRPEKDWAKDVGRAVV